MNISKSYDFKEVEAFELGYAPFGRPLMTTYFYIIDEIIIDTAQSNMRKYFIEIINGRKINKCLLTHFHEDHSGNASILKKLKKISIYGRKLTMQKLKYN
ncbi:MAG: MBL fold metallo-hydrolase, partial [Deltaproteobacteria bacterium]|nr:MBL fold metallo-hydrolase [Deltaproteobacteria bacterium]